MLQSLFKRAEATVDHAVTGLVVKLVVAIPFLIALGFLTAAATIFVNQRFDSGTAYLIMAGGFLLAGVMATALANARGGGAAHASSRPEEAATRGSGDKVNGPAIDGADREMLMTALAAVGPVAAPAVIRLVVRNLPLIAAVAAAGFVLSRSPGEEARGETGLEPAE